MSAPVPQEGVKPDAEVDLDPDDDSEEEPVDDDSDEEEKDHSCETLLYEFCEDPASSPAAYFWSILILLLILIGTLTMILETLPDLQSDESQKNFFIVESVCVGFFTLELVLRLIGWRFSVDFIKEPMNLIDLAAIIPYYIELALMLAEGTTPGNASSSSDTDGTRVLRLFRLIRVFRVFKLSRHSSSMRLAVRAVVASGDTLWLMVFILAVMVITFGGLVYVFEKGDWNAEEGAYIRPGESTPSPFISMPESMWWCLVTIMTVGYGDLYPTTDLGKVAATAAIVCSLMILALPISVIGLNFSILWSQERNQMEVRRNALLIDRTRNVLDQELYWYKQDIQFNSTHLKSAIKRIEAHLDKMKPGQQHDVPLQARELMLKYEHLRMENLVEKCLRLVPISDSEADHFKTTAYYVLVVLMKRAQDNFQWMRNTRKVVQHLEADLSRMAQMVRMEEDQTSTESNPILLTPSSGPKQGVLPTTFNL